MSAVAGAFGLGSTRKTRPGAGFDMIVISLSGADDVAGQENQRNGIVGRHFQD